MNAGRSSSNLVRGARERGGRWMSGRASEQARGKGRREGRKEGTNSKEVPAGRPTDRERLHSGNRFLIVERNPVSAYLPHVPEHEQPEDFG